MPGIDVVGILQVQAQAIKIIGGVPILKNVLGSTLEKLKLPKHLDIGQIESILAAVQSGGIEALLQAPLAAAQTALSGAISNATGALSAALGGSAAGLTSALGSLSSSVSSLGSLASNLAGFTNLPGLANQFDLVSHMGLAQAFGNALPSGLSLATVTAPITSSGMLGTIQGQVQGIADQVLAGTMSVAAGTAAVGAMQAQVDAVVSGSANAIANLAASAPALSSAASTVALLAAGPPEMQAAMQAAIRPDMLATARAVVSAHLAEVSGLS